MKHLIIFLTIFLVAIPVMAQTTVKFEWDLHTQASLLQGFKLYGSKTSPVCTGGVTPPTTSLTSFAGGTTVTGTYTVNTLGRFYWTITAYTPDGVESDCSNEVTNVVKPKPPKLNTVAQVAAAIKGAVTKVAGIFKRDKNLEIVD